MEDKCNKPCREKYWSEKSVGEQVEELKRELLRTQQQVFDLCSYTKALLQHEHNGNKIVRPLTMSNAGEEDCGGLFFRVHKFREEGK